MFGDEGAGSSGDESVAGLIHAVEAVGVLAAGFSEVFAKGGVRVGKGVAAEVAVSGEGPVPGEVLTFFEGSTAEDLAGTDSGRGAWVKDVGNGSTGQGGVVGGEDSVMGGEPGGGDFFVVVDEGEEGGGGGLNESIAKGGEASRRFVNVAQVEGGDEWGGDVAGGGGGVVVDDDGLEWWRVHLGGELIKEFAESIGPSARANADRSKGRGCCILSGGLGLV